MGLWKVNLHICQTKELSEEPKKKHTRALVLISQILAAVAADKLFGNEEPYLKNANGLILKYSPGVKKFIAGMLVRFALQSN